MESKDYCVRIWESQELGMTIFETKKGKFVPFHNEFGVPEVEDFEKILNDEVGWQYEGTTKGWPDLKQYYTVKEEVAE